MRSSILLARSISSAPRSFSRVFKPSGRGGASMHAPKSASVPGNHLQGHGENRVLGQTSETDSGESFTVMKVGLEKIG
jgi:hypothetical protein